MKAKVIFALFHSFSRIRLTEIIQCSIGLHMNAVFIEQTKPESQAN